MTYEKVTAPMHVSASVGWTRVVAVEVEEWSASGSVLHRTVHISDVESEMK